MKSTIFALALVLVVFANCNDAIPINWIDQLFQKKFTELPLGVGKIEMPQIHESAFCREDYISGPMDIISTPVVVNGLNSFKTVTWIKGSNSTHKINSCTFEVPKAGVHFLLNTTGFEDHTYLPLSGDAQSFTGSLILVEEKLTSTLTLGGFNINPVKFIYDDIDHLDPAVNYCIDYRLRFYGQHKDFTSTLANRLRRQIF